MSIRSPQFSISASNEIYELLRALARKSAAAGVAYSAGHIAIVLDTTTAIAVPVACWRTALEKGWIALREPCAVAITTKGRTLLRQILSEPSTGRVVQSEAQARPKPEMNSRECPVAWLSTRRDKDGAPLITAEQFAAAERLRSDYWFAGMSPRITTHWAEPLSQPSHAAPDGMRDHVVAAGERVRRALAAVGPEMASLLVDVCCHLKGLEKIEEAHRWPQRSARIVLSMALTQLARHYGLIASQSRSSSRIEHWGADDYKPSVSRSQ